MSRIRGKDTQPELLIRRFIHAHGFRFRLHVATLPGTPDVVLPKWQLCIFVNGCFWHHHAGCADARIPGTRRRWWRTKLQRTVRRDAQARALLRRMGWRVIDIWECGLKGIERPQLGWLVRAITSGRTHTVWPRRPPRPRSA